MQLQEKTKDFFFDVVRAVYIASNRPCVFWPMFYDDSCTAAHWRRAFVTLKCTDLSCWVLCFPLVMIQRTIISQRCRKQWLRMYKTLWKQLSLLKIFKCLTGPNQGRPNGSYVSLGRSWLGYLGCEQSAMSRSGTYWEEDSDYCNQDFFREERREEEN